VAAAVAAAAVVVVVVVAAAVVEAVAVVVVSMPALSTQCAVARDIVFNGKDSAGNWVS
jgi:hypothetical protein